MVTRNPSYLAISIIITTLLSQGIHAIEFNPTSTVSEAEAKYTKLSMEDKAKRCTGKASQESCNKVEHCCYIEYQETKDIGTLYTHNICVNYHVFLKFFIGDVGKYLMNTESTNEGRVTEDNLCKIAGKDKNLGKQLRCTCVQGAKLGAGVLGRWVFAVLGAGLVGALWV